MAGDVVVLDAWPIVEHYKGLEPAASAVAELFSGSEGRRVMSVVNFTEVCAAALVERGRHESDRIAMQLRRLVELERATSAVAEVAARLKYVYFMALGDSYAVATALSHAAPVWTGDAEILCPNRVWQVRDLRDRDAQDRHERRRGAGTLRVDRRRALADLTNDQIAEFVTSPLRGGPPTRTASAD